MSNNYDFSFFKSGVNVNKKALLLAIDDFSIPLKRNINLYFTKPKVIAKPVLVPERGNQLAGDNLQVFFYGAVIHDNGKFRMWYYPCAYPQNTTWPEDKKIQLDPTNNTSTGPCAYAESDDGINWVKPKLGQVCWNGSKDNNLIDLPHTHVCGVFVIKDDEDSDPSRRYKMAYSSYTWEPGAENPQKWGTVSTAVSADGINWKAVSRYPIKSFFEITGFHKFDGKYIVVGHKTNQFAPSVGGHYRGRAAFAHFSLDFVNWENAHVESLALTEPANPADRGCDKPYDQVHVGIGTASYGNVVVGYYGLWHSNRNFGKISCDLTLAISNDGLIFREPVRQYPYIHRNDSPITQPDDGHICENMLTQGNGILNVGDETFIYHGRWRTGRAFGEVDDAIGTNGFNEKYATDQYSEIALAKIPRDRWGSLGLFPDQKEGWIWTAPVQLGTAIKNMHLTLNADFATQMRIEVADENFNLLGDFSGNNAGITKMANGFDCQVDWPSSELTKLAGKSVRFKISVSRGTSEPRIYAINLYSE